MQGTPTNFPKPKRNQRRTVPRKNKPLIRVPRFEHQHPLNICTPWLWIVLFVLLLLFAKWMLEK
jgi:hypothetical protein